MEFMRLETTAAERLFREEVRDWLQCNVPRTKRPISGMELREFDVAWQRRQFEGGWAGISWPAEYREWAAMREHRSAPSARHAIDTRFRITSQVDDGTLVEVAFPATRMLAE